MAEQPQTTELKRLAPVLSAASAATAAAARLHSRAVAAVPDKYKDTVQQKEEQLAALASPYVALVTDRGTQALQAVDAKVDSAILTAWRSLTANRAAVAAAVEQTKAAVQQSGAASLDQLSAARQAYLQRVEESVSYVQEQGLEAAAKAAADTLLSKVQDARQVPGALLSEISEAWSKLAAMPAVERLLCASRTQVDAAYARYMAAHDALVADPRYASAVTKGGELLASLQASPAYQAAAGRLTPLLAPYAESAAKVAGPYVAKAAAHLAPVSA